MIRVDTSRHTPGIVAGFIPLIVFGLLAGTTTATAATAVAAAFICSVIIGFRDLRDGLILSWATLVIFGSLLAALFVLRMTWLVPLMGILVAGGLALVTALSVLAGVPFTIQYARRMTDPSVWDTPAFYRVNLLMTGVWGVVFTFGAVLGGVAYALPGRYTGPVALLSFASLAGGILFTVWYPGHIRAKHARQRAGTGQ